MRLDCRGIVRPRAIATADRLAEAVSLDMNGHWRPLARSYLGRVTKARILEAVREGVSYEAADRMADRRLQSEFQPGGPG
jgi:ParB family chromosome partitioning protein